VLIKVIHHGGYRQFIGASFLNIFSMKTILVATDYSATADNAVQFAANLARVFKAGLILFNTFNPSNALASPETKDQLIRNNKERLNTLAKETAKRYQIEVHGVARTMTMDTVENLDDYTTWHKSDLVVMGMDSNLREGI
jgi:nucleotide-binding universal stress UspA family protein